MDAVGKVEVARGVGGEVGVSDGGVGVPRGGLDAAEEVQGVDIGVLGSNLLPDVLDGEEVAVEAGDVPVAAGEQQSRQSVAHSVVGSEPHDVVSKANNACVRGISVKVLNNLLHPRGHLLAHLRNAVVRAEALESAGREGVLNVVAHEGQPDDLSVVVHRLLGLLLVVLLVGPLLGGAAGDADVVGGDVAVLLLQFVVEGLLALGSP